MWQNGLVVECKWIIDDLYFLCWFFNWAWHSPAKINYKAVVLAVVSIEHYPCILILKNLLVHEEMSYAVFASYI